MDIDDWSEPTNEVGDSPNAGHRQRPGVFRRLLGQWWRILLLWLLVSIPLSYLIHFSIEPTYEAFSTLRIEPTKPELFSAVQVGFVEARAVRPFLETQVQVIVSNHVLEQAVANPQVVNLPFVRQSDDPKAELRKKMSVEILDNAYIIRVALELPDPIQAATILNSVVEAYLVQNTVFNRSLNKNLQTNLMGELARLEQTLKERHSEADALVRDAKIGDSRAVLNAEALKSTVNDDSVHPAFHQITEAQYAKLVDEILECDIECADTVSRLKAVKDVQDQHKGEIGRQLHAQIAEQFQREPRVAALVDQITEACHQLEKVKQHDKPEDKTATAAAAAQEKLDQLNRTYESLRSERYGQIRARLLAEDQGVFSDAKVHELEVAVETARRKKMALAHYVQEVMVASSGAVSMRLSILQKEVESLLTKREQVTRHLDQLRFEAEQDNFRVFLQDEAVVPKIATNNRRVKYMAALPLIVLGLILCLFFVREIRAGRTEIRYAS